MAIKKTPNHDEAKIAELSKRIVAKALSPIQLMNHVTDFVWTIDENADVNALRTAIDAGYRELRERYEASQFKDDDAKHSLDCIEESMLYYIGLEVGRRVNRD